MLIKEYIFSSPYYVNAVKAQAWIPKNYHENFNELNRDEIFAKIVEWS